MKIFIKASRCPKCYGHLTYEELGSYGDAHDISVRTGTPTKKRRRYHYNHEDAMVYCAACGTNYEFEWLNDAIYIWNLVDDDDE